MSSIHLTEPPIRTFNTVRQQLQHQTQQLLQDRNSIKIEKPSMSYIQSQTYHPSHQRVPSDQLRQQQFGKGRSGSTRNLLKGKIKDIIELCGEEKGEAGEEIGTVIQAEREIYGLLQQADLHQYAERPTSPTYQPTTIPQTTPMSQYTPIRSPQINSMLQQKQVASQFERLASQKNNAPLNEEGFRYIQEVQRLALAEIEKLRNQKIELIKRLNDEIRNVNEEKHKNYSLLSELEQYRGNRPNMPSPQLQGNERALMQKIVFLQNALLQEQSTSQNLRRQLSMNANPDMAALYNQGEQIRQDTLNLLRLKQAKLGSAQGQHEKRTLVGEIQSLKDKIRRLENQNLRLQSHDINQQYSPIQQRQHKRGSNRNSPNDYQSLVMEMKRITSN